MLLIEQTIDAATANANDHNAFAGNRSDCSEAAQLTRAEREAFRELKINDAAYLEAGGDFAPECGSHFA
jgi:hypothetical protein